MNIFNGIECGGIGVYQYFKDLYKSYQQEQYDKRFRSGFLWACGAHILDGARLDVLEAITWDGNESPENHGARAAIKHFKAIK